MKTLIKALALLVLLLLLLVAGSAIYITRFFDPNDYRQQLQQLALERAGLELRIDGELGWTLYPWLGVEVNQVSLAYPQQAQLAHIQQLQISLNLPALLARRVEMNAILLDGLDLTLQRNAEGGDNWIRPGMDRAEASAAGAVEAGGAAEADNAVQAIAGALQLIDIDAIRISNASIIYRDQLNDTRMELTQLDLNTGRIRADLPIDLELDTRLTQFDGDQITLDTQLALQTRMQLHPTQLQLEQLRLRLADLVLEGQLLLDPNTLQIRGQLGSNDFNPKLLLNHLGQEVPQTRDPQALTRMRIEADVRGNPQQLLLAPLRLRVDETQFEGELGFNPGSGHLSLTLEGDRLNADRYLPPDDTTTTPVARTAPASTGTATGSGSTTTTTSSERWSREPLLPVELLQALNLDLALHLEQLQLQALPLSRVTLELEAAGGLINLQQFNARLYGGQLNNSAIIDARQPPINLRMRKQVEDLNALELLKQLADTDMLSGQLSSRGEFTASGNSVHALINSLNGNAQVNLRDGELQGLDMAQTVCQGIQTVMALGVNPQQVDRSTPFASMGGNFSLRNGVVSTQDLSANLDAMRLRGQGSVDLPRAQVDMRLGLTIIENLFKQTCSVNNRLEGVELPVNCRGSFDTPPAQMCRPDSSAFTQLLRQELQRRGSERVEQELRERIGNEDPRQLLRGLIR